MSGSIATSEVENINLKLRDWRQGDVSLSSGLESVHLADLSRPHSPQSIQAAQRLSSEETASSDSATPILDVVAGIVMLSQTCDVIRDCKERPFVEVAPLVKLPEQVVAEVRKLRRPVFAYVPATAARFLVADLDRPMTVEKSIVARWDRIPGWTTEREIRDFALALSRKRARFAFPDDFVRAAQKLQRRLVDKHNKLSPEGDYLRALREIRVQAFPSWNGGQVHLGWWFIKDADPDVGPAQWCTMVADWTGLFDQTGRFDVSNYTVCRLEEMTARDYVDSVRLDLDYLSISR